MTTGASNDIEQATKLSRAMITRYGMSSRFGMVALETQSNPYLGGDSSLSCSPETAATIDDMVVDMVKQSYEKARKLLKDNQGKLHELAKYLYEKETITGDEFMRILSQKELSSDGETASGAEFAADGRQILEEEKHQTKKCIFLRNKDYLLKLKIAGDSVAVQKEPFTVCTSTLPLYNGMNRK